MDIASYNRPVRPIRQTKFISLMDLYEQNYIRLRQLMPEIRHLEGDFISYVSGCMDLHLSVLEQCKYTTIISLTYQFSQFNADGMSSFHRSQFEPNLEVRIYHDARLAECREGTFHAHVQNSCLVSVNKWYLNRFLYKWLAYCIEKGHSFNEASHHSFALDSVSSYLLTGVSPKDFSAS